MSDTQKVRFPFWIKLAMFGIVVALIPTIVVGVRSLDQLKQTLNTDSRAFRAAVVSDVADRVERILVDSTNTMVGVSLTLTDRTLEPSVRERLSMSLLESDDLLDHLIVFGTDGKVIDVLKKAESSFEVPQTDLSEADQKNAVKQEAAFSAPMQSDRVFGVIPLRVGGKTTGYIASYVPITKVQNKLQNIARELPTAKNPVYVMDRQRRVVAHADETKIGTTLSANTLRNNLEKDVTFQQSVTQAGDFTDDIGVEMVGSLKPLKFVEWAVVVESPRSEVYASYFKVQRLITITIFISLVGALLLAILFARRLTAPIQQLVQFSARLAERDFDANTGVKTGDELGVLASAMANAAKDLEASEETIRQEIEIRSDLGRFLSKELVDGIVSREQDLELGGERKTITVLFADVVSFTEMCEDNDPAVVVEILNELFTILTEVVFKNSGTVDKFVGDCIMAFWGAPTASETHAIDAIETAEQMMRFVEFGNEKWKKSHGISVELAIGVHSGPAIVGNVGSSTRMEYTAIGQTVNVAARMEALARPNQILTTAATKDLLSEMTRFSPMGEERINNRGDSISIFEVTQ